jgi:hypothetical protein
MTFKLHGHVIMCNHTWWWDSNIYFFQFYMPCISLVSGIDLFTNIQGLLLTFNLIV